MSAQHDLMFGDDGLDELVNEILDLLEYMDKVDSLEITPPPPLVRQQAGPLEIVDLTGEEDLEEIPVAARLDFTLVVDELDNGGLFGSYSSRADAQGYDTQGEEEVV